MRLVDGFALLDLKKEGVIERSKLVDAIMKYVPDSNSERVDLTLAEILSDMGGGEAVDSRVTKSTWMNLMRRWLQSNSERRHNIVVVTPSTPAQYFHCLRRQIHRYIITL
jgi:RecA-family ATPase